MAQRKWTDEQLSAIGERSKTLLVSAAAGSGKTATLTERIIRSLTDPEHPIGVESLLVVTFTNAATAELRAKLTSALEAAVAADPGNKRLEHQLYMLPSARIRTIDAFCNDVLRSAVDRVGISPSYRIADGAENELLASSILGGMISSVYAGEMPEIASPELFERLADCLTDSKRTEDLGEMLRYVYTRCESSELGVDVLLPMIEYYNPDGLEFIEKTKHGSYLFDITDEMLTHYINAIGDAARDMADGTDIERALSSLAQSEVTMLSGILATATYSERREAIKSFSLGRKPPVKKDARTPAIDVYDALRSDMREDLKKFAEYYSYTEEWWRELASGLYELLSVLYRFERKFDELFLDEKRRRSAFSYGDIERLCYAALIKDGERTDIAENLRSQFDAIYIDEYQDVNSLQNSIFEAISRPDNRFMVGDIKQSIYGFRHARPEIFASMKASFPPLAVSEGSEASIFMSKNFRCDRGIVDFVNCVFDKTFSFLGESIGYENGDRLEYAKIHDTGEPKYQKPEVCMLDGRSRVTDESGEAASFGEAEVVAMKIAQLLDSGTLDSGAPIKPSDVAIILRNARGKDVLFAEALEKLGIPSVISGAKDFFLTPEVLLALCLLNSIDNPRKDIYLAGLMCSPLFGFDADDMYRIRRLGEGEVLYDALVSYVGANPDFEKGRNFLNTLTYYRTIAEGVGVDTLLFKLYRETALFALAEKNGAGDNLMLLYDYARGYEAGAYKGLYNFISFINSIIDKKTSFDDNREVASADAVRIVTCHASKGLEYPVVFLVGAGSPPSQGDVRPRLVISSELGISFRLRTPSGLALVESPIHDLVCHSIKRKNFEEELRVLYVALTRAREQLYVVGTSTSSKRDEYLEKIAVKRDTVSTYVMRGLRSYLEVVLVAGDGARPKSPEEFVGYVPVMPDQEAEGAEDGEVEFAVGYEADINVTEELIRRFTYEYPREHLSVLPEKLSVSRTSPDLLDPDDEAEIISKTPDETDEVKEHAPAFISGRAAEESAKRGIATHYFMQFCDLDSLTKNGAKKELERLVGKGYISAADGERVRIREIEAFTRSELLRDMKNAKNLYRELRFNVNLPASLFTEDEERRRLYDGHTVLVQGVIDCIIEYEDGSIGLYDYKTDRLSPEERADERLAAESLRHKHSQQLGYYALAVKEMFGRMPSRVEVYSLALGKCVDVK